MKNKQLVFGVIFCFFISILFLLVIVWESRTSIVFEKQNVSAWYENYTNVQNWSEPILMHSAT